MLAAAWITAVATGLLAVLAGFTAWYARRAFLKQSEEVRAIEQQVKDGQELARQQADLLKVQSGQLELQRQQLDDQRQANTRQAEVLELQADDLRESLEERKREAKQRRSAQAARVFMSQLTGVVVGEDDEAESFSANVTVVNTSDRPIYDVKLHWHRGSATYSDFGFPDPLGTIMRGEKSCARGPSRSTPIWPSAAPSSPSATPRASHGRAGQTAPFQSKTSSARLWPHAG